MTRLHCARLTCVLGLAIVAAPLDAQDAKTPGAGERFYYEKVLPRLVENGCPKCHATGYLRPNVGRYSEVLRRLAIGDSPVNNAVIYKIANLGSIAPDRPNHPGGQRCASIEVEPCKTVMAWWSIEFGSAGQQP
jgi:hypothetical protein